MSGEHILILVLAGLLFLAITQIIYTKIKASTMQRDMLEARAIFNRYRCDTQRIFDNIESSMQRIDDILDGRRSRHVGRTVPEWSGEVLSSGRSSEVPRENLRLGGPQKSKWFDRN